MMMKVMPMLQMILMMLSATADDGDDANDQDDGEKEDDDVEEDDDLEYVVDDWMMMTTAVCLWSVSI